MTKRALTSYAPFEFKSDFQPGWIGDDVTLPVREFAAQLEQARQAGMEAAALAAQRSDADKLDKLAENLAASLRDLKMLAKLLESAALDEAERETSRGLIERAAQSIIDGQGDLFAAQPGAAALLSEETET
ncbi:MAG: hypothetical protein AAFX03_08005 [Pseudomonadota bacterium]